MYLIVQLLKIRVELENFQEEEEAAAREQGPATIIYLATE